MVHYRPLRNSSTSTPQLKTGSGRIYLAMVDSLDQNIGRVLDALDESSLADNTVIFFLSDNGGLSGDSSLKDYADNDPLRAGKGSFHEGGIHVPFVASWPAMWPEGHTYDPMVISLDIASTVLKLANATSEDPDRPIDGVDLDPFLRGAEEGPPASGTLLARMEKRRLRSALRR